MSELRRSFSFFRPKEQGDKVLAEEEEELKSTVSHDEPLSVQDFVEVEEKKDGSEDKEFNYFGEDMRSLRLDPAGYQELDVHARLHDDSDFEDTPRLECEKRQGPKFCHVCKAAWHPLSECKQHKKECLNSFDPALRFWARRNFIFLDDKINRTIIKR